MKKLLILSGKGGTGKTTIACSFAYYTKARAVADCDVDAPNLHLMKDWNVDPVVSDFIGSKKARIDVDRCIGCRICQEHCRFHAIDVVENVCQVNEFACEGCGVCQLVCPQDAVLLLDDVAGCQKLYISDGVFSTAKLKMGRGNSGKLVSEVKKSLFDHSDADLAIIDGSPGIGCPVIASISGVDLVLIVAEPSMSGLSDLKRLIQTTASLRVQVAVCVNKWDVSVENTNQIVDFCKENGISFVGKIPYDKSAFAAMNEKKSLLEMDSLSSRALKDVFDQTLVLLDELKIEKIKGVY